MKSRRVDLLVGAVYAHRNGCTYRCIGREDGLIWWDYSAGGHFQKTEGGDTS